MEESRQNVVATMFAALLALVVFNGTARAGQIFGVVLGADSTSLAGVDVQLLDLGLSPNPLYQGKSDSTGTFRISNIPDRSFQIRLILPPYPVQWYAPDGNTQLPQFRADAIMWDSVVAVMTMSPVDNSPSASLVARVVDSTGTAPVPTGSAEIRLRAGGIYRWGTSVDTGVFLFDSLIPGEYALQIYPDAYPSQYFDPAGNTSYENFYVVLAKDDSVSVTVKALPNPKGRGRLQGVVVNAAGQKVGVELHDPAYGRSLYKATTDSSGGFSFVEIMERDYHMLVVAPGFPDQWYGPTGNTQQPQYRIDGMMAQWDTIAVSLLASPVDNSPSARVVVTMVDTAASPVPVGSAELRSRNGQTYLWGTRTAGNVFVFDSLIPGEYALEAYPDMYPSQYYDTAGNTSYKNYYITVGANDTARITMTIVPAPNGMSRLQGYVQGANGVQVDLFGVDNAQLLYSTVTNPAGLFSFVNIMDRSYFLRLQASGFPQQWFHPEGNTMQPGYRVDAMMMQWDTIMTTLDLAPIDNSPSASLVAVMRDSTGTAITTVGSAELREKDGQLYRWGMKQSDDVFLFDSLPPGKYALQIYPDKYPSQYYNPTGNTSNESYFIDVPADTVTQVVVVLTMSPTYASWGTTDTGIVAGRVVDSTGAGLPGVIVSVLEPAGGTVASTTTDVDGNFAAGPVPALTHKLGLSHPSFPMRYWRSTGNASTFADAETYMVPANDTAWLNVTMTNGADPDTGSGTTGTDGVITGTVRRKDNQQPVGGARVMAIATWEISAQNLVPSQIWSRFTAYTDTLGTYRISGLPYDQYVVFAISDTGNLAGQFSPGVRDLPMARVMSIDATVSSVRADVVLPVGAIVKGTIQTESGMGVAGVYVYFRETNGVRDHMATTGTAGNFTVKGMAPGEYYHWVGEENYVVQSDDNPDMALQSGITYTMNVIKVTAGGRIRVDLSGVPAGFDSLLTGGAQLHLYNPADTNGNTFARPERALWLQYLGAGSYVSGVTQTGSWRVVFEPEPLMQGNDGSTTGQSEPFTQGISYGIPVGSASLTTSIPVSVMSDETTTVEIPVGSGYSVLGSLTGESGETLGDNGKYCHVNVLVRENGRYIVVSQSKRLSGGQFSFPGLIDGEAYYLEASADGYPTQWWSPTGNSYDPKDPWTFSTANFVAPAIQMVQNPTGGFPGNINFGRITGTVLSANGTVPVVGALVNAIPKGEVDLNWSYPHGIPHRYTTTTDSTGSYGIEWLPTDDYIVMALAERQNFVCQFSPSVDQLEQAQPVHVTDTLTTPVTVNFDLRRGGILTGQAQTTAGKPAVDVEFGLNEMGGRRSYYSRTDSTGAFWIQGIASGEYSHWTWSRDYLIVEDPNGDFVVQEGQTHTAQTVAAVLAGKFRVILTTGGFDSSMNNGLLYLYSGADTFPDPIRRPDAGMWLTQQQPGVFLSDAVPSGSWRALFVPQPLIHRRDASSLPETFLRDIPYGVAMGATQISQSPVVTATPGVITDVPIPTQAAGFSVFGRISAEGGETFGDGARHFHVELFIMESGRYFQVSESWMFGQGRFELPGLIEGRPYFLRASADGYPEQWWSPTGNSASPKDPWQFTTANFVAPLVNVVYEPEGMGPQPGSFQISGNVAAAATNAPVGGVRLTAIPKWEINSGWSYPDGLPRYNSAVTDSAGKFVIAALDVGEYVVAAVSDSANLVCQFSGRKDRLEEAIPVVLNDTVTTGNVSFSLRKGATLTGRMTTTTGQGAPGAEFSIQENNGRRHHRALTDNAGNFTIRGIAAGVYHHWVGSADFTVVQDDNGDFTIQEEQSYTATTIKVAQAGRIRVTLGTTTASDSAPVYGNLYLFGAADTGADQVRSPVNSTWLMNESPGVLISEAVPLGAWRPVFVPQPLVQKANGTSMPTTYMKSLSYGLPSGSTLISQAPVTMVAAGTTSELRVNLSSAGYSVFGTIQGEGGEAFGDNGNYFHIQVFVQENGRYYKVSESYRFEQGRFELPGLIDGQSYFLRLNGDGYPEQWWSPIGNTVKPTNPWLFRTSNFVSPAVLLVRKPGGYIDPGPGPFGGSPIEMWGSYDKVTREVKIGWRLGDTLELNQFTLYKMADGAAPRAMTTATIAGSPDTVFEWRETLTAASTTGDEPTYVSYVVTGSGAAGTLRSYYWGVGPDQLRRTAAGMLWIDVAGSSWGTEISWGGDTALGRNDDDVVLLHRSVDGITWKVIDSCWGRWCEHFTDSDWDRVTDAGKTFTYKVELRSSTGTRAYSELGKIALDAAFIAGLAAKRMVGPYELYKTIQSAVDASKNGDEIRILPGTYKENVSFKGKVLEIGGEWRYGEPPVIDGNGGTAVTVPFVASTGTGVACMQRSRIEGIRFVNSMNAIVTSSDLNVNRCLFDKPAGTAIVAAIDSVTMASALRGNPFVSNVLQIDVWGCTFAGRPATTDKALSLGALGVTESPSYDGRYMGKEQFYISPVMSLSTSAYVNNSIFYRLSETASGMFERTGHSPSLHVENSVHWPHLASTDSTGWLQVDGDFIVADPMFADTVLYFLPADSKLQQLSRNGSYIGYDEWRGSGGPRQDIGPVQNYSVAITGPAEITVTWAAPQNYAPQRYVVYRIPGDPALFHAAPSGQWEPTIPEDSLFAMIDTFSTAATFFVDRSVQAGKPYIYAVAARGPNGEEGRVDFPSSRPITDYIVMIEKRPSPVRGVVARPIGFGQISVTWTASPSSENVASYRVYRVVGLPTNFFVNDQSEWEPFGLLFKAGMVDSFSTQTPALVDNSAKLGVPYVYAVAAISRDSAIGPISLPYPPALDAYIVRIDYTREVVLRGKQWHMVGPVGLDTLRFSASASRYIYQWNDLKAEDKLYSRYDSVRVMAPRRGYWFWYERDTLLQIREDSLLAQFGARPSVTVALTKGETGWNQVSSPYPYPTAPAWVSMYDVYGWNGLGYEQVNRLEPGKAYWIQVGQDTTLTMVGRPASSVGATDSSAVLAKRASALSWEVQVALSGENCSDPSNFLGVIPKALARSVRRTSGEPPPAFDHPQVFFVGDDEDRGVRGERMSRLYQVSNAVPEGKLEWAVGISASSKPATLRFSGIDRVPRSVHLFWVSGRKVTDLREHDEIAVPAHEGTTYGYVVATANRADLGLYTGSFALRRTYPNPFVHTTTIEFTVPYRWRDDGSRDAGETQDISLCVFGADGRLVSTLVAGAYDVGSHRIVWDGRSDQGEETPSGFFIARLTTPEFAKSARLFKIR